MLLLSNRLKFLDEIFNKLPSFCVEHEHRLHRSSCQFTAFPLIVGLYFHYTLIKSRDIETRSLGHIIPKNIPWCITFFFLLNPVKGTYFLIYEKICDFTSSVPLNCCWSTRYLHPNEKTSPHLKKIKNSLFYSSHSPMCY